MFFYPKTVETRFSKINGEIKVTKLLGTYRLVVGGCTQSGGLLHNIWGKALKTIDKQKKFSKPEVLILGFGGGTAAKIVDNIWPEAIITGIEIDSMIIDLTKKYFQVDRITNLKIFITDAIEWVKKQSRTNKFEFDLILIDMYIGSNPPPEVAEVDFLESLNRLIKESGIVLFNKLIVKGKKSDVVDFQQKLAAVFTDVSRIKTPANAVFLVQKKSGNYVINPE